MIEQLKRLFARKQDGQPLAPAGELLRLHVYSTTLLIEKPTFAHLLHERRDLGDPALLAHLNELCDFVLARGDGQMTQLKYHVMLHLQRVQHHLTISAGKADAAALMAWARGANALLYVDDGAVLDPDLRVLVGPIDGKADPEAQVPYPDQAWVRKARTEAALAARGIVVPATLPPLVCESELVLRERDEIIARARALLLVALRAESVASGEPMSVEELTGKMPLADDALTPKEQAFLALAAPTQKECGEHIWRYESLNVLEWVLGLVDELAFPAAAGEQSEIVARLIGMRGPEVRNAGEILDALDLTYRLHWLVRQQRLKKKGDVAGVDADVLMQRHHALNWLVRFQHAPWDAVNTPT
jgi:hypothetical protein